MAISLSLLPVIAFLAGLIIFDSFRLIRFSRLLQCIGFGVLTAVAALLVNTWLQSFFSADYLHYSKYISPLVEESLKASLIVWMVVRKKAGFTIDAAIYGFSIGTGFALTENIQAIMAAINDPGWVVWLLRGFGTATMHGGSTALFAILFVSGIQKKHPPFVTFWPGWLVALLVHSGFNHFIFNPFLQTALIFIILPAILILVFQITSQSLRNWLETGLAFEIQMLVMIRNGNISESKTGMYLKSLQDHFKPEQILDIYCYLSLYLELSIIAKRNIILKECNFPVIIAEDTALKLQEYRTLGTLIGKTGKLALQPLLSFSHRELWNINQLDH